MKYDIKPTKPVISVFFAYFSELLSIIILCLLFLEILLFIKHSYFALPCGFTMALSIGIFVLLRCGFDWFTSSCIFITKTDGIVYEYKDIRGRRYDIVINDVRKVALRGRDLVIYGTSLCSQKVKKVRVLYANKPEIVKNLENLKYL